MLMWSQQRQELLSSLAQEPRQRILSLDFDLDRQLCALTNQAVFFGTPLMTPDFHARLSLARDFLRAPDESPLARSWRIDRVIVRDAGAIEALSSSPSWTLRGAHGPFRDFARREPNLSGD